MAFTLCYQRERDGDIRTLRLEQLGVNYRCEGYTVVGEGHTVVGEGLFVPKVQGKVTISERSEGKPCSW